ncbi:MAG: energy transducer TonB [Leadbetterella sp.]|nr:energy transducer TonB [Leadbetterella sp.]
MKVTLDDMVFETRNKEYGAYYLRKNYRSYLTRATVIGTALFSLLFAGALAFNKIQAANAEKEIMVDLSATNLDEEVPEEEIEIPEDVTPPPLEEPPPEVAQEKFLPPEPKKDEEVTIEEPPPSAEKLETAVISNKTVEGVEAKDVFIPPPPPKEVAVVKVEKAAEEEIFMSVEQDAQFPGGMSELMKYLNKNVKYPAVAQRANVGGKVVLRFVVEKDGSVAQISVLKSVGFGCDEEAVRVVKSMPKWSPGKQNGRPVRVWYTLPVTYTLQE